MKAPTSPSATTPTGMAPRRRAAGWRARAGKPLSRPPTSLNPGSVQALFDAAIAALGVPDLLIANAGVGLSGMPVANMEDATRPVDGGLTMNWGGA